MNEMMAREIAAQAEVLPASVQPLAERAASVSLPLGRVFAGGCGDSAIAPAALRGVFECLGIDVIASTSMTLASFTRFVSSDTVILSSISGSTRRTVEAAKVARERGARVIAITCNGTSSLAQAASEVIVLPFEPMSRKTPHTLDYTMTVLALSQLALAWSNEQAGEVAKILEALPSSLIAARGRAEAIAAKMNSQGKLFILGAGPDLATAEYGVSKFHEAGGLVAIASETENFIHGQNFMVEPNDTIIALGGNSAGLKRGREIIEAFGEYVASAEMIAPEPQPKLTWSSVLADLLSTTFILQHLCLATANRRGLMVELPRAGRPSGDKLLAIQRLVMAN